MDLHKSAFEIVFLYFYCKKYYYQRKRKPISKLKKKDIKKSTTK